MMDPLNSSLDKCNNIGWHPSERVTEYGGENNESNSITMTSPLYQVDAFTGFSIR
jgi:hypothetical protein